MKIILLAILIFAAAACGKNAEGNGDRLAPGIDIDLPLPNATFTNGETVHIAGTIADNGRVVEVHVHIYDASNNALLIDIHRFPDIQTYTLNENFVAAAHTEYKIQVIAKDDAANQTVTDINISSI